jgi:hypothetical protein
MFQAILDIWTSWANPEPVRAMCFLPAPPPPAARPRAEAPKKPARSIYVIDEDRNEFGFHLEKAGSREGAVSHLTEYDKALLVARQMWGGKEVVNRNIRAKALWYTGESIEKAMALIGVKRSWVEHRYGTFSTALSQEVGEGAK